MSSLIQNMCRTCMLNESKEQEILDTNIVKMETQMVSIYTVNEDSIVKINLWELLKITVPQLNIKEVDPLPKIVCLQCEEKIKEMYLFQQNCLCVEKKFYKTLEQHDIHDPLNDNPGDAGIFVAEVNEKEIQLHSESDTLMMVDAKEEFIDNDNTNITLTNQNCDTDWEDLMELAKETCTADNEKFDSDRKNINDNDEVNVVETNPRKGSILLVPIGTLLETPTCDELLEKPTSDELLETPTSDELLETPTCDELVLPLKKPQQTSNNDKKPKKSLKTPKRTQHKDEKRFLCSQCGKKFSTSGDFKEHLSRHLGKTQITCPDCPKTFSTKNDLYSHANVHKKKLNHMCDVCGKSFYKPCILKKHLMFHNNDKPYSCEHCNKLFVTKEKMNRHILTHTGEKPYRCKYCESAYQQSNDLLNHLRKKHLGNNVHQCELCPLRFRYANELRVHFATHKDDDEETRKRNLEERTKEEQKLQLQFGLK